MKAILFLLLIECDNNEMAKAIERKYLVHDTSILKGRRGSRIVQGCTVNEPMTVRVRIIDDEAFLTLKSTPPASCATNTNFQSTCMWRGS